VLDRAVTVISPTPTARRQGACFESAGLNVQCPTARPRDNRSPAASEGRYRGSDLARVVTGSGSHGIVVTLICWQSGFEHGDPRL